VAFFPTRLSNARHFSNDVASRTRKMNALWRGTPICGIEPFQDRTLPRMFAAHALRREHRTSRRAYFVVGASFAFCENNQEKSPVSWPLVFVGVMNKPAEEWQPMQLSLANTDVESSGAALI